MKTISGTLEHYSTIIQQLIKKKGEAHVSEIALAMGIKQPSVISAMRELKGFGLIAQKSRGPITFTAKGRPLAARLAARQNLLKHFLMGLGIDEKSAEANAIAIGHLLSADALTCISRAATRKAKPSHCSRAS